MQVTSSRPFVSEQVASQRGKPSTDAAQPSVVAPLLTVLGLLAVPSSLFWLPIFRFQELGNVVLGDAVGMLLIATTLGTFIFARRTPQDRQLFWIFGYAVLIGIAAEVGASTFRESDSLFIQEFSVHMKRFGLAAILPLAMRYSQQQLLLRAGAFVLLGCDLGMTITSMFPDVREMLPIAETFDEAAMLGRATGIVSNPNDLAYISILCAVSVALATTAFRNRAVAYALLTLTALASLINLVLSASRSGLLGLAAGFLYFVFRSRTSLLRRTLLLKVLIGVLVAGWIYNELFQERLFAVYVERQNESNFSARLEAQSIAIQAALRHPLGVGFSNFTKATADLIGSASFSYLTGSDSIYCDTLLAAGLAGLACLIICFLRCWRLGDRLGPSRGNVAALYRSGLTAVFVFGLATASPASVFVSATFFYLIGTAAILPPASSGAR
jgi:O-antigen ligase